MTPAEEAKLASWLARADWPQIRPLLQQALGTPLKPLDELIKRVRRDTWKDFS